MCGGHACIVTRVFRRSSATPSVAGAAAACMGRARGVDGAAQPSPSSCPEVAIFTEGILITGSGWCPAAVARWLAGQPGLGIVGGTIMVIADSWGRRSAAHRSFFRPAAVSREGGAARARVQLRLARTPAGCGNDPSVASSYRVRDDTACPRWGSLPSLCLDAFSQRQPVRLSNDLRVPLNQWPGVHFLAELS